MKRVLIALLFVGCGSTTTHLSESTAAKPVLDCGFMQVFEDDGMNPAFLFVGDGEKAEPIPGICRGRLGLELGYDCRFEQEGKPALLVQTFLVNGTNDEYAILSSFGQQLARNNCTK